MSTNRISWKRVFGTIVIIVALLIFSTIWSQTHKSEDNSQQAEQTTSSNDQSTSKEDSSGPDANASETPAQDTISVNEMQATIESLQQQIVQKDTTIGDLQQQITDLQNGTEKIGGLTFRDFLNLYFWSDGHIWKMAEDKKLYSDYSCKEEYRVDVNNYTFPSNRTMPFALPSGLNVHMLMTTDGQILWTVEPWLNQVQ